MTHVLVRHSHEYSHFKSQNILCNNIVSLMFFLNFGLDMFCFFEHMLNGRITKSF